MFLHRNVTMLLAIWYIYIYIFDDLFTMKNGNGSNSSNVHIDSKVRIKISMTHGNVHFGWLDGKRWAWNTQQYENIKIDYSFGTCAMNAPRKFCTCHHSEQFTYDYERAQMRMHNMFQTSKWTKILRNMAIAIRNVTIW